MTLWATMSIISTLQYYFINVIHSWKRLEKIMRKILTHQRQSEDDHFATFKEGIQLSKRLEKISSDKKIFINSIKPKTICQHTDEWRSSRRSVGPVQQLFRIHTNQGRNIAEGSKDQTGASTLSHGKASSHYGREKTPQIVATDVLDQFFIRQTLMWIHRIFSCICNYCDFTTPVSSKYCPQ